MSICLSRSILILSLCDVDMNINYSFFCRSQLELLVNVEEDGETVVHYLKCEKGDTMGQSGVKPFADLRVTVERQ